MIPKFIVGMPLFNITKCSEYIYNALVKKGFKVTRVQYNHFMIYWGHVIDGDGDSNQSYNKQSNKSTVNYEEYIPRTNNNFRNINDLTNNSDNFIYDLK